MIRRDRNGCWLLISQVDHARIAAEIAATWGNNAMPPLPWREQLLPALRHHDDGWAAWERTPEIDPQTGQPRDFTEMPMATAAGIWTRSIDRCRQDSLPGGLWVSRHFCWLAERARQHRDDGSPDAVACDTFLETQTRLQDEWRTDLRHDFTTAELDDVIDRGFRLVQVFDRLSLWLCCRVRTRPETIEVPGGPKLQLIPRDQQTIALAPFPLNVARLALDVPAWRIPARTYGDDAELQREIASAPREILRWELVPESTDGITA